MDTSSNNPNSLNLLHEFDEMAQCPKCGNSAENTTVFCQCPFHSPGVEHLIRACSRCGASWNERVRNIAADVRERERQEIRHNQYAQNVNEQGIERGGEDSNTNARAKIHGDN